MPHLPHFYPRPPRGGRLFDPATELGDQVISIHALREEGDDQRVSHEPICPAFLSTPSARRATCCTHLRRIRCRISIHALREEGDVVWLGLFGVTGDISIHALREEGDAEVAYHIHAVVISIHALREEGDRGCRVFATWHMPFLSTPSARRATVHSGATRPDRYISIHALREEGDPSAWLVSGDNKVFLSTPSARRATRG